MNVSPLNLAFAVTIVGTTSAAQIVTLTNKASTAVSIRPIAFTGTNATDYSKTQTWGSSLAAGASCTVSVTFKPATKGSLPANLSITNSGGNSPQLITLTGSGS